MNLGEAAFLAAPRVELTPYAAASSASRAAMFALIVAAHAVFFVLLVTVGKAVIQIVQPTLLVELLPEPASAKPAIPTQVVPLPQLRKPEIVIPEPPRFETLAAVQVAEKPVAIPTPPPSVPVVAGPAEPVVQAPRFDLAYLNNPAPSYPVFAKRAREQGKVLLRVQVGDEGQVVAIEIHQSSGSERLDKAALAAVRQWRFVPARSGEKAVAGVALVPITFKLEG